LWQDAGAGEEVNFQSFSPGADRIDGGDRTFREMDFCIASTASLPWCMSRASNENSAPKRSFEASLKKH